MNLVRELMHRLSHRGTPPAPAESTRTELERAQQDREVQRERTDHLARLLNDYRQQDGALRR